MKDSIEESIKSLYEKFFIENGIDKKNGTFHENSRWSFLKFPTYPLIGSLYAKNKDYRVLFIGLDIGKDKNTDREIIDFSTKRESTEGKKKHNPHAYGMGVATIFLLKELFFTNNQWKIIKGLTYKDSIEIAEKIRTDFKPFSYFAMTNYYKFVTKGREKRQGSQDRKHISAGKEWDLLEAEVRILEPKFLVFESKKFQEDYWLQQLVSEIKKQNANTQVYISNHPSSRGLHSHTSEYLETFNRIQ